MRTLAKTRVRPEQVSAWRHATRLPLRERSNAAHSAAPALRVAGTRRHPTAHSNVRISSPRGWSVPCASPLRWCCSKILCAGYLRAVTPALGKMPRPRTPECRARRRPPRRPAAKAARGHHSGRGLLRQAAVYPSVLRRQWTHGVCGAPVRPHPTRCDGRRFARPRRAAMGPRSRFAPRGPTSRLRGPRGTLRANHPRLLTGHR